MSVSLKNGRAIAADTATHVLTPREHPANRQNRATRQKINSSAGICTNRVSTSSPSGAISQAMNADPLSGQ